jgi:hypothetical protein
MSLLQEMEQFGLADCEFNRKFVSITKDQLRTLEMLGVLGGYYLENMGVDNSAYESDKEMVEDAQEVIKQIEQQFMGINNA